MREHYESTPEVLRDEYQRLLKFVLVGPPIPAEMRSIFRQEEAGEIMHLVESRPVIIEGTRRAGKTSALYQLRRECEGVSKGVLYLSIDRFKLTDFKTDTVEIFGEVERHRGLLSRPVGSLAELAEELKLSGIVGTLDECSKCFLGGDNAALALIREMHARGVPFVLAMHYGFLEEAVKRLPFLKSAERLVPRPLTREEIQRSLTTPLVYPAAQEPLQSQIIKAVPDAAEAVIEIAGVKPFSVNFLVNSFFLDQAFSESPTAIIDANVLREFWVREKEGILKSESTLLETTFEPIIEVLRQRGMLDRFLQKFGFRPEVERVDKGGLLRVFRGRSRPPAVPEFSNAEYQQLAEMGLIRRNPDESVVIDGLITREAISDLVLQIEES